VILLSGPDRAWKPVQSSDFLIDKLQFGDFNGDGVTDVLAVVRGHWAVSDSATGNWHELNANLGDAVENLLIANMDRDDNIDDILRLERHIQPLAGGSMRARLIWWRSRNGVEPWRRWKDYVFKYSPSQEVINPVFGYVGRFGAGPGGGVLIIDPYRFGHFYSEAEIAAGAEPEWKSLFPY
jgi:hypothetical protein